MADPLESRTLAIGREIFRLARGHEPSVLSASWLDDRAMALSMHDEAVKAQLFRFTDALPTMRTAAQVVRHLREYLGPVAERLPAPARWLLRGLGEHGPGAWAVSAGARIGARRLARRFIVGTNLKEALATIGRLRRDRLGFTIDLLGEAILSEDEADSYQRAYLDLIAGLADAAGQWSAVPLIDAASGAPLPRVNVSVKLSALSSRVDPCAPEASSRAVRERLRPILRLARSRGVFINVDMESHALKDITLRIFRDALDEAEFKDWRDVGIAIQAYLRSCGDDLAGLAAWAKRRGAPVWVRLVKGAYWDYETVIARQNGWEPPVFTDKHATDANYEAQIRYLFAQRELLRPAFGSHNVRSIAYAMALAESLYIAPGDYEFQMLYGMADPLKHALVTLDQRVRVYTPFGQLLPGMAYLVRRLLENTSNQSFVRAGFLEHLPEEQLLMDPATQIKAPAPPAPAAGFCNEPIADFSRADVREAMTAALGDLERAGAGDHPLVIGGKPVTNGRWMTSINPSHRKRSVGRAASAGPAEAEQAVAAARAAFPAWRDTPAAQRAAFLDRAAAILRRRRWELSATMVAECGKSWREADADVAEAVDFCGFYAAEIRRLAEPRLRNLPGERNEHAYEGRGVAVMIAPWNFPLAILCGMTAAALAAGNTAIMKPAEQSPVIAAKLMAAFVEAGAPAGVVNFLPGVGEEIGPLLVGHRDVSIIAFTGSRDVGLGIIRTAAVVAEGGDEVKRVICEMGGKNAIIVDDDADLDEAVSGVMWSAFGYQGQKCSACSRAIVVGGVYDAFLARLVAATRSLGLGPAEDPASGIGPVIDDEALQRIRRRIEDGRKEARLVYAGDAGTLADEGCYVAPHIFAEVPPAARLAQEEIFGPVLAVMKAKDLGEALAIANGTRYALTGGFYSRSPEDIARVRRELRVGNLYINRKITGALVDRQPFGGFKLSGVGAKAGGPDYLQQFMVPRAITENTLRHGFTPDA